MARPRDATCPNCGRTSETKAQPRTVLRCRSCGEHFLAPALSAADEALATDDEGEPVVTDDEMAELAGPQVVRVDSVSFPAAEVHPPATDPPPDPAPVVDASPASAPAAEPAAPEPVAPVSDEPQGPPKPPPSDPSRPAGRRAYGRW